MVGLQTFALNLGGVTSFSITQGAPGVFQIDNVAFSFAGGGGVPEASTWALMLLGFGAAGGHAPPPRGRGHGLIL